jgi:hypothetical protein
MDIVTDNEWKSIPPKDKDTGKHYVYILNQRFNLTDFVALIPSIADDKEALEAGFQYRSRYYDGIYVDFKSDSDTIYYKYGYVIEKVNK